MSNAIPRVQILSAIKAALEPLPFALAMWEGGAASFGRVDEWSDIDLQVAAQDERVAEISRSPNAPWRRSRRLI